MQSLAIQTVNIPKISFKTVAFWVSRARTRAALAKLDNAALADIGLSRHQANEEAQKPFWV